MTVRSKPTPYSVAHSAAIAGCSQSLILALVEEKILEAVPTAFGPSITRESLLKWLNTRPEALRLPPKVRPQHETREAP